ncbi:MAG: RidA family protein [Promethearchaeota archaeon]
MVNIKKIELNLPKGGPYSHCLKVGEFIYISGQVGNVNSETGEMESKDIESQTKETLEKIKNLLIAANSSVSKIIKLTVFMKDIKGFQKMNKVYQEFFNENGVTNTYPTRSTVEVSDLVKKDMLIEIDCIAIA